MEPRNDTETRHDDQHDHNHVSDAELAAAWCTQALADRRYALAAELAHVAERAARAGAGQLPTAELAARAVNRAMHDAVAVPLVGITRDERPARLRPEVPQPPTLHAVPAMTADTALIPAQVPGSHAPSTCTGLTEQHGSRRMCAAPIRWNQHRLGWYHLDGDLDQDHQPTIATAN